MALQKTIEGAYGDTVTNAYIRIDNQSITRNEDGDKIVLQIVNVYNVVDGKKKFVRELKNNSNEYFTFTLDIDSADNCLTQGYTAIKAEVADTIDV